MMTPAAGSKLLEETFTSGQVFKSVGGKPVQPHMYDGNYVVASNHKRPWQKQLNMLAGYLYFYNPVWLAVAVVRGRSRVSMKPAGMQVIGMMGVVMTIARTSGWATSADVGDNPAICAASGKSYSDAKHRRHCSEPRHVRAFGESAASAGPALRVRAVEMAAR